MYSLQTTVTVNGKEFHITNDGDYRMVLDCFDALNDEELSEDYRVLASLLIFYNEFTSFMDLGMYQEELRELVQAMYRFFNCGQEQSPGAVTSTPLIDWTGDSQMICSAINRVAGTEVRALPYLHWWTFMGYYCAIGESPLSTVVGIRDKLVKHKKLDKWEQDFKRDNPRLFSWKSTTVQDREVTNLVKEIWNTGGK